MNTWKTSTLLVLALFALSVVFLFANADVLDRKMRATQQQEQASVYSPAAADPRLRSEQSAREITSRRERPVAPAPRSEPPVQRSVEQTTPVAQNPIVPPTYTAPSHHKYYVVVGTFSNYSGADRHLKQLKRKGLPEGFIGNFDEGQHYTVIAKTFVNEASARAHKAEIDKLGIESYVLNRSDD